MKLQALVRGQLVRKQASATLRYMEALLTAQARACAQRIKMASEERSNHRHVYDFDESDMEMEENIRIVKVDVSGSRDNGRNRNDIINYSKNNVSGHSFSYSKEESHKVSVSPAPSIQSSPASSSKPDDKKLHFTSPSSVPNYMANTESSKAKFRSHSAPKQRPDTFERQLSRPRASTEARNGSHHRPVMKMRRSSSHVGSSSTAQPNYQQYPSSIKLDRSSVSLVESECGSTSTVLTNSQYCRSLVSHDVSTVTFSNYSLDYGI